MGEVKIKRKKGEEEKREYISKLYTSTFFRSTSKYKHLKESVGVRHIRKWLYLILPLLILGKTNDALNASSSKKITVIQPEASLSIPFLLSSDFTVHSTGFHIIH